MLSKIEYKLKKFITENYFGAIKFSQKFQNEKDCDSYLFNLKYPNGFICKKCNCKEYYRLKGSLAKRNRIIECANSNCKKQISITAKTIFEGTKISLIKWFWAFFFISQTKKGISACLLSKQINVSETTALSMLYKIRKEMEEDEIKYQIGGDGSIVEADEIDIGGEGSEKQKVLVLLEKNKENDKLGRIRFSLLPDKSLKSIESHLVQRVKAGTELHTDGNQVYDKIVKTYFKKYTLKQVSHSEENYSYEFLKDLDTIVSNLKKWYRGIHHHFSLKNTGYYLNEFAYRFNRRRSEINIFDRLLARSVLRTKNLKYREFIQDSQYLPVAC